MTGTAAPKYRFNVSMTTTGSVFSVNDVKPRRSAKSAVSSTSCPPRSARLGSARRLSAMSGDR